jgi:formylglycine-generating enzyme required for sulfatase activity
VLVTRDEARAYCRRFGLRLPTEAEWERAARWEADRKHARIYAWGDEPPRGQSVVGNARDLAWLEANPRRSPTLILGKFAAADDCYAGLAPVDAFPEGASPVGALNMTGNAREWVEDLYIDSLYIGRSTASTPVRDPCARENPMGTGVSRGGCFIDSDVMVRAAFRKTNNGTDRNDGTGFRVAVSERDGR